MAIHFVISFVALLEASVFLSDIVDLVHLRRKFIKLMKNVAFFELHVYAIKPILNKRCTPIYNPVRARFNVEIDWTTYI